MLLFVKNSFRALQRNNQNNKNYKEIITKIRKCS